MPLPFTRNSTYSPGSPLLSNDMNALQDAIIGGKRGPRTAWTAPGQYHRVVSGSATYPSDAQLNIATSPSIIQLPVLQPLYEGDVITDIGCRCIGTGVAQTLRLFLVRDEGNGSSTTIGTLTMPATPPATWATYSIAITPETVVAGKSYLWMVNAGLLNTKFSAFSLRSHTP